MHNFIISANSAARNLSHAWITVEPLYNGQVGVGGFVRYKEVSFIGRLVQECICNPYKILLSCHEVYMIHVHN